MKQSNRLLKVLIATALGILLFTGAVFAILNLTSGDSNKKSTSSSSQKSESNKNKTEDKNKKEHDTSKEEDKKEETSNTQTSDSEPSSQESASKNNVINNNVTSSNSVTNNSINSSENQKTEKPATNSNDAVKENEKPKELSSIEENPNYTVGRIYEYNGKKLSPIAGTGNTGKVFSTQAEAAAYGQAEIEKRVKETKKFTSYSVGRVLYEDGTQAGWTVDIYSGKPQ